MKYGKLSPLEHPRTLKLSNYLTGELPKPRGKSAWEYSVPDEVWSQSMLGNDTVGDCVIAAMLHWIMAATANTDNPVTFTTEQALGLYSDITGYNPSDPNSDQGTVFTDALNYWLKVGCYGHKILGWASIKLDIDSLQTAIDLFGGILVGTQVTESMENQFGNGEPWNSPFSGEILGGHGIPWLGYGKQGQTCITWAKRQQMSPEALQEVDEAYAVITQDWIDAQGTSPSGLDLSALQADLKLVS